MSYLLSYYTKYFKGNFFINFSIVGLTDAFGMLWIGVLGKRYNTKKTLVACFGLIIVISTILQVMLFKLPDNLLTGLVPLFVFLIRLQSAAIQNYGY